MTQSLAEPTTRSQGALNLEMVSVIADLRNEIGKQRKRGADGSHFFCTSNFKALLTEEAVAGAVQECGIAEDQRSSVLNRILAEGKIVFAILIWKSWHRKLIKFIEHDALDSKLPLDEATATNISHSFGWDFALNAQWEFLPRIFKKEMSVQHFLFRDEEILPFTEEVPIGEGAFGDVFKVFLEPSLQTIHPDAVSDVVLVKKKLRNSNSISAGKRREREHECLRILNHFHHPNIIQLLASYSHRGFHYFLFPWLKLDLEQFLQRDNRYGEFNKDYIFYTALEALASAIATVHALELNAADHDMELRRIGYHHDLRPANILVGSKTFYLADFGLGRLKLGEEGSETAWKSGLGDYVAPECYDEKLKRREVGRPLDIWSFGCMLAEIGAYIEGNSCGVRQFRQLRDGPSFRPNLSDQYFFSGSSLKPSVTGWVADIKSQTRNWELRRLLEIAFLMLEVNPEQRPKARTVSNHLSVLSVKVLFEAVRRLVFGYVDSADEHETTKIILATIELESSRLVAWGKMLRVTVEDLDSSVDAFVTSTGNAGFYRDALTRFLTTHDVSMPDTYQAPLTSAFPIRPLHEDLRELVDRLWNSLPTRRRENLRQAWLSEVLADHDHSSEVFGGVGNSALSQYLDLGTLAATKLGAMRLENEGEPSQPLVTEGGSMLLPSDGLHIEKTVDDGLGIGHYNQTPVLIEWVPNTAKWKAMSEPEKEERLQLTAEVFHLTPKPSRLRVLDCLGFVTPTSYSDGRRDYGLLFSFPLPQRVLPAPTISVPITLHQIATSGNKFDFSLGDRFRLAYKLAGCIGELHTAGWLHENINSKNVVFFKTGGQCSDAVSLEHPFVINFRSSRPSEDRFRTEYAMRKRGALRHYMHPEYSLDQRHFREEYDYYGLGVVLLELGSWATLDTFLANNTEHESDPSAFRTRLISKYVPRLRHFMGTAYSDVVLSCLLGQFDRLNPHIAEKDRQKRVLGNFYEKVVGPLSELSRSPV